MGSNTPNLNLYKPARGERGWGNLVDQNLDIIDAAGVAGPDADTTVDAPGAAGNVAGFARTRHGHKITTTDAPSGANIVIDVAPTSAPSGDVARARHGHRLNTYVSNPVTVNPMKASSPGTQGFDPSRGNHAHALEFSGANVSKLTNQQLQSEVTTVITFGSVDAAFENFDTDNYHSLLTNVSRMTVSRGGFYSVQGSVSYAPGGTGFRLCQLRLNGSGMGSSDGWPIIYIPTASNAHTVAISINGTVFLNNGDYIELLGNQGSGVPLNVNGASLGITFIGQ